MAASILDHGAAVKVPRAASDDAEADSFGGFPDLPARTQTSLLIAVSRRRCMHGCKHRASTREHAWHASAVADDERSSYRANIEARVARAREQLSPGEQDRIRQAVRCHRDDREKAVQMLSAARPRTTASQTSTCSTKLSASLAT